MGGTSKSLVVSRGVTGLSTQLTADGNVGVSLSVDEAGRVRTLSTEVFLLSGR